MSTSKCEGYDCERKASCERFVMPTNPNGWQLWFVAKPVHTEGVCDVFIPNYNTNVTK